VKGREERSETGEWEAGEVRGGSKDREVNLEIWDMWS